MNATVQALFDSMTFAKYETSGLRMRTFKLDCNDQSFDCGAPNRTHIITHGQMLT
jgi:hypothetical protein